MFYCVHYFAHNIFINFEVSFSKFGRVVFQLLKCLFIPRAVLTMSGKVMVNAHRLITDFISILFGRLSVG